jgi:hypothetical protein
MSFSALTFREMNEKAKKFAQDTLTTDESDLEGFTNRHLIPSDVGNRRPRRKVPGRRDPLVVGNVPGGGVPPLRQLQENQQQQEKEKLPPVVTSLLHQQKPENENLDPAHQHLEVPQSTGDSGDEMLAAPEMPPVPEHGPESNGELLKSSSGCQKLIRLNWQKLYIKAYRCIDLVAENVNDKFDHDVSCDTAESMTERSGDVTELRTMEVVADDVLPGIPVYEEDANQDVGVDRQDGRYTARKNAGVATAKALAFIAAGESEKEVTIRNSGVMANGQSSLQASNKNHQVVARKSSPNSLPAPTTCPQQQPSQFGGGSSSSVPVCNGINRINTEKPLLDWKDIQAAMERTSGECWIILFFGTFVSLPAAEREKISPLVTFSQLSLPVISECRKIPVLFGTFVSPPAAEKKKISPLVTFSQLSLLVISVCRNIPVQKQKTAICFEKC